MTVTKAKHAVSEDKGRSLVVHDLTRCCEHALEDARDTLNGVKENLTAMVVVGGEIDNDRLERHQHAVHGFAWQATYVAALEQMLAWAKRLKGQDKFGELERLLLQASYCEYLHQIYGGIPMSQGEFARLADVNIAVEQRQALQSPFTTSLREHGFSAACKARIAELIGRGNYGELGLEDETLDLIRDQFHRFVEDRVVPNCHEWHEKDALIPMEIVERMAELGVFGLTIAEKYGGLGMGRMAMCVVTEELSRGYIGVGSLGTRSEIAGDLIQLGGTDAQKEKYLPKLASGEILPTAVFTEPNTGSDLASLKTRAVKDGDVYRITGNKTWITHAARSDLMTVLARTNMDEKGYGGLSMFLAEKPRGAEDDPFPAEGMTGGEIEVLGYRGMKEYELGFDDFEIPADSLLGEVEGRGFKHLMATFEGARVQTAARAVGVARNAMETGFRYAEERIQFGKPILRFPRVHGKLAWMAVETMVARQLTYFAAAKKEGGERRDIEAGMAKLLAARVAWSNADNALQIHGGNGYATEYPISRILCDARILNIFEGAAEIQAHVVARGLLTR